MRIAVTIAGLLLLNMMGHAQSAYADKIATNTFLSNTEAIYGSENDFPLVKKSAELQMGNLSYKIHHNLKKHITK